MFIPFWTAFRLRQMMCNRAPLSDNDFVRQVRLSSNYCDIVIALRRAFARCCKIPPEAIYPGDSFYDLANDLMYLGLGWDETEFLLALEEEGFSIKSGAVTFPPDNRYAFWRRRVAPGICVSEWIAQVAPQITGHAQSQTS
jgi:hypothetical protein